MAKVTVNQLFNRLIGELIGKLIPKSIATINRRENYILIRNIHLHASEDIREATRMRAFAFSH